MLTVHSSGGSKMLRAATDASRSNPGLIILAVTVLTSMAGSDLEEIGMPADMTPQVVRLARLAIDSGCQGIVSSAREVPELRRQLGEAIAIVTPGVRPAGASHGDQARVVTPAQAIATGASHIVVGRAITQAPNPSAAARAIVEEMTTVQKTATR
jgi:orotidine-5'-phosphate decarboxylase